MSEIPKHLIAFVRELAAEGKPVPEIAFMTRLTESAIREILAQPVTTTEEAPSEDGAGATS